MERRGEEAEDEGDEQEQGSDDMEAGDQDPTPGDDLNESTLASSGRRNWDLSQRPIIRR